MARIHELNRRKFIRQCSYGAGGVCLLSASRSFGRNNFYNAATGIDKWSKEATYYIETPKGPKCLLCPNSCTIKEGDLGDCRNRANYSNKIYSIAYGNPCAVHVDPIEKKPLYHFLPTSNSYSIATAGCNLACLNCQNWTISQTSPRDTRNEDLMPDKVVSQAITAQCKSISYTYSEPITFYEYVFDTSKIAHTNSIKNVLVSNGYINETPLRALCKVIDAANIDLKSFSNDIYLRLNSGTLQPVLNTLKIMKEEGVWLEITNLVIPGWTDNLDMIKKMCGWLAANNLDDTPLHFSRFQPLYKLTQLNETPVSVLTSARDIAKKAGLQFVYIGNVPGSNSSNTSCPTCNKLLVERIGLKIVQNYIKQGQCSFCNTSIPGVWS